MAFPLFKSSYATRDIGILLIRLGVGFFMFHYGFGKVQGGPEKWAGLGEVMEPIGLGLPSVFWGAMASYAEMLGGAAVFLGVLFGPGALFVAFTMAVATASHLIDGETLMEANQSTELFFVFLGLALIGPGRYSIDALIAQNRSKGKVS